MKSFTILASFFCNAWSTLTYALFGMPDDKKDRSYFANGLGFFAPDPNVIEAWALLKEDWSFHHLKNLLVEWVRADPQRAAKLLSFLAVALFTLNVLQGGAWVASFLL